MRRFGCVCVREYQMCEAEWIKNSLNRSHGMKSPASIRLYHWCGIYQLSHFFFFFFFLGGGGGVYLLFPSFVCTQNVFILSTQAYMSVVLYYLMKCLLSDGDLVDAVKDILPELDKIPVYIHGIDKKSLPEGIHSFDDLMKDTLPGTPSPALRYGVTPTDTCCFMYTSGTTGCVSTLF